MTRALLASLAWALSGCAPAAPPPPPPPAPVTIAALDSPRRPSAPPPAASPAPTQAPARSSPRRLFSPCEGPTAIPDAVARTLAQRQESSEHCELHQLSPGRASMLFVRTMSTVAHDDDGRPSPVCAWSVFQLSPPALVHTLDFCEFSVENGCVVELDGGGARACF